MGCGSFGAIWLTRRLHAHYFGCCCCCLYNSRSSHNNDQPKTEMRGDKKYEHVKSNERACIVRTETPNRAEHFQSILHGAQDPLNMWFGRVQHNVNITITQRHGWRHESWTIFVCTSKFMHNCVIVRTKLSNWPGENTLRLAANAMAMHLLAFASEKEWI